MLKHINEDNFKTEVLESEKVTLVDFFATWCGPCQMLAPVLEKISNSRANFDIAKIDIDQLPDLAVEYGVEVVPTMVIFKNGKVMNKFEGFKSESEIVEEVSKYMGDK